MARSVIGDLVWRVTGDTSQVNQSLKSTDTKVRGTGKELSGLTTLINGAVIGALVAMGKAAFDAGKRFDAGLANVATLLNDPNKSINELKDNVKSLSIETGLSLDDLTDGLYQTVSAFGDTAEATKQLELAAIAAKAGVATVTDSINLASAVTKAYGDTSAAAQEKVFDLAFQTVKLGQTSFPELANSIQNVTDRSQALGVSQEELFAVMATLTGVTGNASIVSTQLKSALVALDSPTAQLSALYKDLGVESGRALIEQEGLQGAFQIIFDESERTGVSLNDYFGRVEAVTAASALASSQSEIYASKLEEVTASTGAATAAFEIQQSTINRAGAEFDSLIQSVEVLKTSFYDLYSEDLANIFSGFSKIIEGVSTLNDKLADLQDRAGLVGDILKVLNPIGALKEYNQLWTKGIGLIGTIGEKTEEITAYTEEWVAQSTTQANIQDRIEENLNRQAAAFKLQADELQRQIDLENERVGKIIEGRQAIEESYSAEIDAIESKNALGLLSEQEYRDARLAQEEQLINDLIALGYDGVSRNEAGVLQAGNETIQRALERRLGLNVEYAGKEFNEERNKNKIKEEIEQERIDAFRELKEQELEADRARNQLLLQNTLSVVGAISGLFTSLATVQALQGDKEIQRLQAQVDATEEGTARRVKLEEELEARKKELAMKEYRRNKLASIFSATVNTAAAITNALATPPFPVGVALASLAAASGAAQLAAIQAQPLPQFAAGGIVPGPPSNTDNTLALVRSGEEIIPEEDPRHSLNGNGGGELMIRFDPEIFAAIVIDDFVNTGRYTIDASRGIR